jgi:hypothetical protein
MSYEDFATRMQQQYNVYSPGFDKPMVFEDGPDCYPWREVFAWLPHRTITGKTVWLKKVYKRRVLITFHLTPHTQWATLFEIMAL